MITPVIGTGSGVLRFVGSPVTESKGYRLSAQGLLPSVTLLCRSGDSHLRAGALVAGFVLECSLKAFIVEKDGAHADKPLRGHDLEELWLDAVNRGLLVEATPPPWCVTLNSLHYGDRASNKAKYRYCARYQSGANGFHLPPTVELLLGLELVVDAVEQFFNSPV